MNIDLGRVTPIYRGIYAAGASYELNDIVLYSDGCLYWHTKPEATTGVAPTDTAAWTLAFSGDDVEAAIEQIKEDAEAIAFGTRGGLPVGSSDPYYHKNAAWYASQASASATDANAAKVAAQGAQGAAETARDKSAQWATGGSSGTPGATNNSKYYSEQAAGSAAAAAGSAQDAEAWAAGTKAGVPVTGDDPQYENNAKYWSDEAAASAATFVTDPTLSVSGKAADAAAVGAFNQYISLLEEEDRQILFGSVAEVATDEYSELRYAPIHKAITIGGSVYPRMDRTRMAIDAIRGRTVAFNQLIDPANFPASLGLTLGTDGYWTGAVSAVSQYSYKNLIDTDTIPLNHVVFVVAEKASNCAENFLVQRVAGVSYPSTTCIYKNTSTNKAGFFIDWRTCSVNDVVKFRAQYIDLTAQYGTTLADQIYALEQATTGAGVAYVRQRLDLDYYAANSGELKAPVVSGVGFVGFNQWDEEWRNGYYQPSGAFVANSGYVANKNAIPVLPNTEYAITSLSKNIGRLCWYDANMALVSTSTASQTDETVLVTSPSSARYLNFDMGGNYGNTYKDDICVNVSVPSKNGTYEPYTAHTSLTLPSTRLDGVGTAQDTFYVREDGENDYSLIKTAKMNLVDLGTLTYSMYPVDVGGTTVNLFRAVILDIKVTPNGYNPLNIICAKYPTYTQNTRIDKCVSQATNASSVDVLDNSYSDTASFKTAMSGVMLCYEKATPTETVIASHLTLAEVSAIAENGGIISIVNENGHIVQPDFVADVVISRSAS